MVRRMVAAVSCPKSGARLVRNFAPAMAPRGRMLPYPGIGCVLRRRPTSECCATRGTSGRNRRTFAESGYSADMGQQPAELGRHRATCAQMWDKSGQHRPSWFGLGQLARIRPLWGPTSPLLRRGRPRIGQIGRVLGQLRPNTWPGKGQVVGPKSANVCPKSASARNATTTSAQIGRGSTNTGSNLANAGLISAKSGPILCKCIGHPGRRNDDGFPGTLRGQSGVNLGYFGIALALSWHLAGTALILCWYCTDAIPALHGYCAGAAQVQYWHHAGTELVLVLSLFCTGAAPALHWSFTGTVLVLHRCIVLVLHRYCAGPVIPLYWHCAGTTLVLHWSCISLI